jgi:regulator of sirC expression with transglutaminase-like and TPR domain
VSRLADILMGMDDKRTRRPGLGGIPGLGESAEPRRQWRIAGTLVILVMMGTVAVAIVLRPPASPHRSAHSASSPLVSTPAAVLPAAPAVPVRDRVAALMRTGMAAVQTGEMDEAASAFRKAVEVDPADAEAWSSLGVVLVRAGDETRGVEAFRRALRAAPGHPEAHRNLAVVLDRQGRGAEAARHYRAFLAKSPADSPDRASIMARLEEMGGRRAGE